MRRMKTLRKILTTLALTGAIIPTAGCASKEATAEEILVTRVQRGNLTMDIVSGGNLALSKKEDLAFDVAGTVTEVLVAEGEAVTPGQIIAKLDTAPLEETVKTAEQAVTNAEIALEDAKDGEFKIKTAEYDLETTINNYNKLNYPYSSITFIQSVPTAIEAIRKVRQQLNNIKKGLEAGPGSEEYDAVMGELTQALTNLSNAYETLNLGQTITFDIFNAQQQGKDWSFSKAFADYQTARSAQIAVEKAQQTLEQTKRNVKSTLDKANLTLDKASNDLKKAKDNLAKAVITAPFAGFITKVNVEGGDEIQKGTVAVQLAEPDRFEAKIMVGEKDIFQVKEGGAATIQIDAMSTIVLPARVTHISPTGTVQSGVVNYEVLVAADSIPPAGFSGQGQPASSGSSQSRPFSGSAQSSTSSQRTSNSVTQTAQLREGLSVTVNIIVAESKNVLLVPNGAITRSGRDTTIQVMKNKTPETRAIKTGISNWQYTEVTEGLTEGEQVVVPRTTTSTTTPTQGQRRPFIMPGFGVR